MIPSISNIAQTYFRSSRLATDQFHHREVQFDYRVIAAPFFLSKFIELLVGLIELIGIEELSGLLQAMSMRGTSAVRNESDC